MRCAVAPGWGGTQGDDGDKVVQWEKCARAFNDCETGDDADEFMMVKLLPLCAFGGNGGFC